MSNTVATTTIDADARPLHASASRQRLKTWGRVLSHFLAGQACLQAVNAVTGLLLLRWLSVTAYAQFSVAFGFQSMIGMFVDLGFSGSIVALVGDRGDDAELVGRYIRSAQHFRRRMFVVMALVSVVAFPLLTYKQHWGVTTSALLLATILASVFFQGWGMYTAPLLIHRRLKDVYTPQVAAGVGRGVLCFLLHTVGALSAWTTALISAATLAVNGLLFRKNARDLIVSFGPIDPKIGKEMISYLTPIFPVIIFTALQGQVMIGIITLFGHTKSIAEIAALGRLGQLFLVFNAFINVILMPYFAKLKSNQLFRRYCHIAIIGGLFVAGMTVLGFCFPQPFLWLLGSKYAYLKSEVGWIVTISSINLMASAFSEVNSARKWRYWWYAAFEISTVIIVQVLGAVFLDLTNTEGVIFFGALTALSLLLVHMSVNVYGLITNSILLNKELASG